MFSEYETEPGDNILTESGEIWSEQPGQDPEGFGHIPKFGRCSKNFRDHLLQIASEKVMRGGSIRAVGHMYNIPRTTLHDYMTRRGLVTRRSRRFL